jgi:8-oxo-dGTP pyrophosphatase MutT (NUDIX family)
MTAIRSISVSVYLLRLSRREDWEVLLLERANPPAQGAWFQVTGRLEAGEAAVQAAWREVHEETGLTPDELYTANWVEQWFSPEADAILLAPVFVGRIAAWADVRLNDEAKSFR